MEYNKKKSIRKMGYTKPCIYCKEPTVNRQRICVRCLRAPLPLKPAERKRGL